MATSRKVIEIFCIAAIVAGALMLMSCVTTARTLVVNQTDPPCTNSPEGLYYQSIQAAINAATGGDEIIVCQGTYKENLVINKSNIVIQSVNGSAVTIIASNQTNTHVANITDRTNVTLQGFTIRDAQGTSNSTVVGLYMQSASRCTTSDIFVTNINASGYAYGITSGGSNNTFSGTIVTAISASKVAYGIAIGGFNNTFSGNTTVIAINSSDASFGIVFASNNSEIRGSTTITNINANSGWASGVLLFMRARNNKVSGSTTVRDVRSNNGSACGILLFDLGGMPNEDNEFHNCSISNISSGAPTTSAGIRISGEVSGSEDNNLFEGGKIFKGDGPLIDYGVHLAYSSLNTVTGFEIRDCAHGVWLDNATYCNISANNVWNNSDGIYLASSNNNFIYNNYFNNTNNAYDDGNNIWNITKTSGTNVIGGPWLGGNYWSDYGGEDTATPFDGLGDTLIPYNSSGNIINGGDYRPLVHTKTNITIPTATGTGNATITTSSGYFCEVAALNASYFLGNVPDSPVTFFHGFFNITICGLNDTNPETITINFTFPSPIPTDAEFWKYNASNGTWYRYDFGDNDGDNVISITITDNGPGDHNPALGTINDPNGIGWLPPAVAPVPIITPLGLIALVSLLSAIAAVAIVRKRH
jgi:nitrous oxidase accessory protein